MGIVGIWMVWRKNSKINNNDRVFIVSKEKSKQFLEDSRKNVISPKFLKKCLNSYRLLNKKRVVVSMEDGLEDIEIIGLRMF